MRILLCNDDGYRALGINTLARHLREARHEVYVVAPSEERSGQSHAMTFFRPIQTRRVDSHTWSVQGTPADCAALALHYFLKEQPPELVISGINHGLNVGWDVNYSGTVGAATEASLLGFRAIAVSVDLQHFRPLEDQVEAFDNAARLILELLPQLGDMNWGPSQVLNVNHPGFPHEGVRMASCAGYSMYVPTIVPAVFPTSFPGTEVFMIGGSERQNQHDASQDVTLVQQGYATLSFLRARQSSVAESGWSPKPQP